METVVELGEFDTGLYSGCEFNHSASKALLTVYVDEVGNKKINFNGVRSFSFTALPNCTAEMIAAYFEVVDLGQTKELSAFVANDQSNVKRMKA